MVSIHSEARQPCDAQPGPHIQDPMDPEHKLDSVLTPSRRKEFLDALIVGRDMLQDGSTFAKLIGGDADLCSPVTWDVFLQTTDLVHHSVRPSGHPASNMQAGPMFYSSGEVCSSKVHSFQSACAWVG